MVCTSWVSRKGFVHYSSHSMDQQKPIDALLEVVIREFYNTFKIEAHKNGNKKLPINGDRLAILDLNGQNFLHNLGLDLKLLASLNLSHCDLTHFPNLFDATNNLIELNLSHNQLTEVPQAIFHTLGFLERLDLSHNKICQFEGLPKCVFKLRMLRLNNNCLTNIPQFILKVCCLNLEEFYYSYNEIISMSPSQFLYRGPYRLKKFELKNCIVRSQDLKYLKQIRTLQEFDLSNEGDRNRNSIEYSNGLENFFDNALWDDQLIVLKLSDLHLSDIPASISKLVNLQELCLSQNNLMWLPDTICLLKELKTLDVSENKLFSLPIELHKLKKLEVLKAANNAISELPNLMNLPNLKHLDLYDNNLDKFCLVNWDIVLLIDLDYNYFNTHDYLLKNYIEKKTALRQDLQISRKDKPKEVMYDIDSDIDNASYASEEGSYQGGSPGEFKPGNLDESWSSSADDCDNGCTASDNEWTGSEKPVVKRKTVKRRISRPPSWMLEDID